MSDGVFPQSDLSFIKSREPVLRTQRKWKSNNGTLRRKQGVGKRYGRDTEKYTTLSILVRLGGTQNAVF